MAIKRTGLAAFTQQNGAVKVNQNGTETEQSLKSEVPGGRRKRGRGETVALTVKVKRSDWQRLRQLADAEGTTIQAMAEAGFSAVFSEHGLPPVEPYIR